MLRCLRFLNHEMEKKTIPTIKTAERIHGMFLRSIVLLKKLETESLLNLLTIAGKKTEKADIESNTRTSILLFIKMDSIFHLQIFKLILIA